MKKFKSVLSAGKIVVTNFWDKKGIVLVDFLPSQAAANSNCYIETVRSLILTFVESVPQEKCKKCCSSMTVLGCTHVCAREAITYYEWTILWHPPYSPHLAPSDY